MARVTLTRVTLTRVMLTTEKLMHVTSRAARTAALLALALLSTACVRRQTDPVTGRSDFDIESPFKKGEDFKVNIAGTGPGAGITGRGEIRTIGSETTVAFTLNGAQPGAVHPWHVHDGKCDTGGPIVGNASDYSPLQVGNDGKAQGNARVSVGLSEAKPYHINIHASSSDMGTIIACGNLVD